MKNHSDNKRRKQFSSCDACRKSRIRCAPREGSQTSSTSQCVRCAKRGLDCTYVWLQSVAPVNQTKRKKQAQAATVSTTQLVQDTQEPQCLQRTAELCDTSLSDFASEPALHDHNLHQTLRSIFNFVFEPIFGIWLSAGCCPYGDAGKAYTLSICQITLYLDQESCECSDEHLRNCVSIDPLIQQALDCAIDCFSVRWLCLASTPTDLNALARQLWLRARTVLLRVIDRPSYRSILALYLFNMTPLPPGFNNEDADSHLGEVLVQIALRQFHVVRAKRRNRHFSGSMIMEDSSSRCPQFSEHFALYESLMYWIGVMIDTSTSMTLGRPSTLCAGILGFEAEPIFQLLRSRNQIFEGNWLQSADSVLTEEQALHIVSSATAYGCCCWKAISVLREAIVYGHEEKRLELAQNFTVDTVTHYRTTYLPLLTKCEKNLLFFNKQTRLAWYLVNIHYHMGILILCEVLTSAGRTSVFPDLLNLQAESVREVLNTVGIVKRIPVSFRDFSPSLVTISTSKTLCLLSIDPFPHHAVVSLHFVVDHLLTCLEAGSITQEKVEELSNGVLETLELLPQCSQSFQDTKANIQSKLGIHQHQDNPP